MKRAFTIIELLVVLAIIAIFVVFVVPTIVGAMRGERDKIGSNTVGAALSAARQHATRNITFLKPLDGGLHGTYSGTALLVTPSEMRLIENYQTAQDTGNVYLETMNPPRNGYVDIKDRDYISIPKGVGIAGLERRASGLHLLSPPFALRFNQHGHFVSSSYDDPGNPNDDLSAIDATVFYDGDGDGAFNINSGRTAAYNPKEYDPERRGEGYRSTHFDNTNNKHAVAFERIESVIAVVVFDKDAVYDQFGPDALSTDADGTIRDDVEVFILDIMAPRDQRVTHNGQETDKTAQAIFLNRYTGTPIRNDKDFKP